MKGKLKIVFLRVDSPKINYLFYYEEILYKIKSIDLENDTIISESIYDSNVILQCDLEEIKEHFFKLIIETDKTILPIIRGDYKNIFLILKNYAPLKNVSADRYIQHIIDGTIDFHLSGSTIQISTNPKLNDTVELINIHVIDTNKLYEKNTRFFSIINIESSNGINIFELENKELDIKLRVRRGSFVVMGRINKKELFTIKNKNENKSK